MIREEQARQSAIKQVYKNVPLNQPRLNGVFKSGDMWAVCDSYRFIRTKNKPDGIPDAQAWNTLNLDTIIPPNAKEGEIVYLPTASEIKSYIKEHKFTRVRNPGQIEALSGWWCNPFYLLDMVQAMPDAVYYRPDKPYTALYCECEDGDALLCPVRHSA